MNRWTVSCSHFSSSDINSLVGNNLPVEIPQVVVKWLTYCLVLHIVALGLAAISAFFGLLAHIREMSMTCFSTCISGFAAAVALLAFIFDIAIFFAAKSRINSVGSAELGNATWLTLAAWLLLFFSGCFYTIGRCCISKRGPRWDKDNWNKVESANGPGSSDAMRLDAVKAEADRKARQNKIEGGLPAFHEVQPLTGHIDGNKVYVDDPAQPDNYPPSGGRPAYGVTSGGYVQKPPGTRAVDEYYSPTRTDYAAPTYPPEPQTNYGTAGYAPSTARRQPSSHAHSQYSHSNHEPSTYAPSYPEQYVGPNQPQSPDPYYNTGAQFGHAVGGSLRESPIHHPYLYDSYLLKDHDSSNAHPRTNYPTYDSYEPQQPAAYNNGQNQYSAAPAPAASASYAPGPSNYYQPQPGSSHQNEWRYASGDTTYSNNGYGANSVPPPSEHQTSYYPAQTTTSPPPGNINSAYTPHQSAAGPSKRQNTLQVRNDDEAPPTYEAGTSAVQGSWGKQ
ncbi:hypothetical protein C0993_002029 [Termitomyces sp. T159_Od127]|nr:hypothetical protein C0993_002029 [Termitomyces sp. T159_Od127]